MEKYRKFGDAATGVNPFVFTHKPTIVSNVLAAVLFPFRLLIGLVLALLLLLTDFLLQAARNFFIAPLLTPYVLHPLQSLIGQLFLFVMANLQVKQRVFPKLGSAGAPPSPRSGDVVLCNMQSPLDIFVLLATGGLSAWKMPYCIAAFFCHNQPYVVHFGPNPFQRWQVLRHVLYSTTRSYLQSAVDDTESVVVDLTALQRQAAKLGVPILLFPEGTTTNGRGVLLFPKLKIVAAGAGTTPQVHLLSLRYTSPSLNVIIDSYKSWLGVIYSWSSLVGNSAFPSFPEALVTLHKQPVEMGDDSSSGSTSWTRDVREKIAQGVSYGNRNIVCLPVSLQGKHKHDFAVYYHSFGKGSSTTD